MSRPHHITLLVLATAGLGACRKPADGGAAGARGGPVPVVVATVQSRDVAFEVSAFGSVEAVSAVDIKAQVGGELLAVNFSEGQDVKKGDLLFTISPKLYSTQLAQAEANLSRDRAQAAQARRDAMRQEQMLSDRVASLKALDQARSLADSLEATVKADEALRDIATVQLGYTTIKSPISGRTGALIAHAGNIIKANADESMVTIRQISPIYVTFAIDQSYLGEIQEAMKARPLAVSALDPRTGRVLAEGTLTFVDNAVDLTTRNIMLKASFPNDDRALWPGLYVDAILHLRVDPNRTVAPSAAVTIGQKGTQIFVINAENSAELRPVTVTRTVNQESIIESGVRAGEKVVVLGQSRLVPGAKVIIQPAAGGTPGNGPDNPRPDSTPGKAAPANVAPSNGGKSTSA